MTTAGQIVETQYEKRSRLQREMIEEQRALTEKALAEDPGNKELAMALATMPRPRRSPEKPPPAETGRARGWMI